MINGKWVQKMLNRDAMSFVDNRHLYLGECTGGQLTYNNYVAPSLALSGCKPSRLLII